MNPVITKDGFAAASDYLFRTAPSETLPATLLAAYAAGALGARRAAILSSDGERDRAVSRALR